MTSWTKRTRPSTTWSEVREYLWSSSVYPWLLALPWQWVGEITTDWTERTRPDTSWT